MRLFIDTNVWLDYFIDRSVRHDQAGALITQAVRHDIELLAGIGSVKDCYFLLSRELKRMATPAKGAIAPSAALAANEAAWTCIATLRRLATVIASDEGDLIEAMILRAKHPDLEDNLLAAGVLRARADFLVTEDRQLLAHAPVPCLDIESAIAAISPTA